MTSTNSKINFSYVALGLGLHGLQRHASFPQPSQTRMPKHVAGHPAQVGAAAGAADDLIEAGSG